MALDHCKKNTSCLWKSYYRHSMSILHAWIIWEMASSVCWKIHCGVKSAHLLCNGNNTFCLCLAFTSLWVYCMLGYSGKWHHYSVENSLWCIECTFTTVVPVSYSLFKTLNKQLYQLHQSWFTITANCVWVKLGIVHFGINAPSLWCVYGVH